MPDKKVKKAKVKPKVKAKVKRSVSFRRVLRDIESYILREAKLESGEGRKLWDVLTALRGPDDGDVTVKAQTTEIVRSAAFPKLAKASFSKFSSNQTGALFAELPVGKINLVRTTTGHFKRHIEDAANALGVSCTREY